MRIRLGSTKSFWVSHHSSIEQCIVFIHAFLSQQDLKDLQSPKHLPILTFQTNELVIIIIMLLLIFRFSKNSCKAVTCSKSKKNPTLTNTVSNDSPRQLTRVPQVLDTEWAKTLKKEQNTRLVLLRWLLKRRPTKTGHFWEFSEEIATRKNKLKKKN